MNSLLKIGLLLRLTTGVTMHSYSLYVGKFTWDDPNRCKVLLSDVSDLLLLRPARRILRVPVGVWAVARLRRGGCVVHRAGCVPVLRA